MAATAIERQFYSPAEYAQVTGASLSSIWAGIRTGEIASTKLGGKRIIPISEIRRLEEVALASARGGAGGERGAR